MGDFKTLTDIVRSARSNLDKGDWDYLVGAADTEASLRRNRGALDSWTFLPRILRDVSDVKTTTQILGQTLRIPVLLPPIGSVQAFTKDGVLQLLRLPRTSGCCRFSALHACRILRPSLKMFPARVFISCTCLAIRLGWMIRLSAPLAVAISASVSLQIRRSTRGVSVTL